MDEALHMFTTGSTWIAWEEHIAGTMEMGKRADFTVFAADPRQIPVEDLPDLPVTLTVLGGECMFVG